MARRYYNRRYYPRARTVYARGRRGFRSRSTNKWVTFGAGVAGGFLAPTVIPFQNEIAMVGAVAPVKMPRPVRSVLSGYVIGRILRNVTTRGPGTGQSNDSPWY